MESKGIFYFAHILYFLAFTGFIMNMSEGYTYLSEYVAIGIFLAVLFATDFVISLNEERKSILNTVIFTITISVVYLTLLFFVSYNMGNYTMFLILTIFFVIDMKKSYKGWKRKN